MKVTHIGIWTQRLEELREFYINYFGGVSSAEKYKNPKTGFESYFVRFKGDAALELMSRSDVTENMLIKPVIGIAHFAFELKGKEEVLALTERLRADGYSIVGEPRITGDGYFESVVLDVDGNTVELVAE